MRHERYGHRDLTYSAFHRTLNDALTYIDLDACEYCQRCWEPLALIETARYVGHLRKQTGVMERLARLAGLRAYLVFYTESAIGLRLRVGQVWPERRLLGGMGAAEFEHFLMSLRLGHVCRPRYSERQQTTIERDRPAFRGPFQPRLFD